MKEYKRFSQENYDKNVIMDKMDWKIKGYLIDILMMFHLEETNSIKKLKIISENNLKDSLLEYILMFQEKNNYTTEELKKMNFFDLYKIYCDIKSDLN